MIIRRLSYLLLINSVFITIVAEAQNPPPIELESLLEEIVVSNLEQDVNISILQEELDELRNSPIDINNSTKRELEELRFLSPIQIESILSYIYFNRGLQSVYELQLIEHIDLKTSQLLSEFIKIEPLKGDDLVRKKNHKPFIKQDLSFKVNLPLYEKKGFKEEFLGPNVGHSIRYSLKYNKDILIGFTAKNEIGEPFLSLYNKYGYDFYSFYLEIKNKGILNSLVLGNYRVALGQGLVMGRGFYQSRWESPFIYSHKSAELKKHSSTDAYHYLSGYGLSLRITNRINFLSFCSIRKYDGLISNDTLSSISKTNLHRTEKDFLKQDAAKLLTVGGHLSYSLSGGEIGISALYYKFDKPYYPQIREYSKYGMRGINFYNLGLDYNKFWKGVLVQGEIAVGKEGVATFNKVSYRKNSEAIIQLSHRYYSHDYWAFYAQGIAQGSKIENENGWTLLGELNSIKNTSLTVGADFFSSPWWRYRVSKPSKGVELFLKARHQLSAIHIVSVQYRIKNGERDLAASKGEVIHKISTHKIQAKYHTSYKKLITYEMVADGVLFLEKEKPNEYGYALTNRLQLNKISDFFKFSCQFSYHKISSYDARIYAYEKTLPFSFSSNVFTDHGIKLSSISEFIVKEKLFFLIKYGYVKSFNRMKLGNGLDEIENSYKSDFELMFRIKL